ncbi:hypothetical protein BG011_009417 [Mortierella polycephala]|uniref:Major facilitator superfamily (MFS) profile domain-containing protein n=1 Tax=Mortierella polycephala TaxID=41804 RepID=A0A9P6U7N4_9FUNG|nr:hypothetical protein BG011_009417 [Mortierella polycephala]
MTVASYLRELVYPEPKTDDPKNWPTRKKNIVIFTIAYCAFVAPLGSNIYMPAVLQVKDDLNTTSGLISATLSVYVLFMGIMPVFWASLCDYFGRRPIYLMSMFIFILGSIFAALSHNVWVFFFMRAIQAFGSSSVLAVGGGSLSDVFHSGERGKAFGFYYLGPLIAPMIGPMIGGVIADRAGWRTTMWFLLGTAVVAFLLVLFLLPETYRQHIDVATATTGEATATTSEATVTNDNEKDGVVSRSHIHLSHSDPTLVASKSSLHENQASEQSSPSPLSAAASVSSGRLSIHSHQSKISNGNNQQNVQMESAMECILPNSIPPFLMTDDNGNTSGSSSAMKTKDDATETDDSSAAPERHVAFPNIDQDQGCKEESEVSTPNNQPVKRKPFNPLRPFLCLREPTNALLVGFNALSLGAQFCMSNTMPISFGEIYHLNETTIGLCFCAGGFGSVLGSLLGGRYSDFVMRRWLIKQELKRQRDQMDRDAAFGQVNSTDNGAGVGAKDITPVVDIAARAPPEIRLRSVWLGVFILPLGLFLFGWSVQKELHLAAPLVGIFLVGFGMMLVYASTTTALVDANSENNKAAAAVACNSFARGVTGAIGGFTALPMLDAMGNGWLYTFWAFMTIIGSVGLVVMVVKAKSWREKAAEKALNRV